MTKALIQALDLDANRFGSLICDRLSSNLDLLRRMSATPNPDLQKPWEFYASTFSSQLRGTDDWSLLHMSVAPNYLDFDDPQYGLYYLLKFCDTVPLWQGRYAGGPLRFYDAYKYIVTSYAIEFAADPTRGINRKRAPKPILGW